MFDKSLSKRKEMKKYKENESKRRDYVFPRHNFIQQFYL